jgi:hypothetical protein
MFKATHKRRATTLSKTFLTAGLLGGAALSTLGAGSAQAANGRFDCSFGNSTEHTLCNVIDWATGWTLEDKKLTNFSFDPIIPAGGPPSGTFAFIYSDFGPDGLSMEDTWQALAVFDPILPPPSTGSYKYDLLIIDPDWVFKSVELDVIHSGTGQMVTKTITGDDNLELVSINGVPDPIVGSTPLSGTSITVMDEWMLAPGGNIAAINNTFTQRNHQVPAPLPLLGVGAAFGSIRKLRKFSSQLKTFSMG